MCVTCSLRPKRTAETAMGYAMVGACMAVCAFQAPPHQPLAIGGAPVRLCGARPCPSPRPTLPPLRMAARDPEGKTASAGAKGHGVWGAAGSRHSLSAPLLLETGAMAASCEAPSSVRWSACPTSTFFCRRGGCCRIADHVFAALGMHVQVRGMLLPCAARERPQRALLRGTCNIH